MKQYLTIIALCELHRALMNLHRLTSERKPFNDAGHIDDQIRGIIGTDGQFKEIRNNIGDLCWLEEVERYCRITIGDLTN